MAIAKAKELLHGTFLNASERERERPIEFIDMDSKLAGRYQYYTKAEKGIIPFSKLWKTLDIERENYLEESIEDYVHKHLSAENPYLQMQQVQQYYNEIQGKHA